MITFNEMWSFLKSTYVSDHLLHIIDPDTSDKLSPKEYLLQNSWEYRFDIEKLESYWENAYTFIIHSTCISEEVREIIEEVERDNNVDCQAHIYAGKYGSKSFPVHADDPDNLIVQCVGKSRVTIYNEYGDCRGVCPTDKSVSIKEQHILEPGQSIFIPSRQYHLFEPLTDRLSISIPMYKR